VSGVSLTWGALGSRLTWRAIGGLLGSGRILLLTTTERTSLKTNTAPLVYFRDGKNLFSLAFYGGSTEQPSWYLNLKANPQAEIQINARHVQVTGTIATTQERARLVFTFQSAHPKLRTVSTGFFKGGTDRAVACCVMNNLQALSHNRAAKAEADESIGIAS
jgi:deazaflavin-dependent oxidoreductase (nitroreductase family)